MGNRTGLEELLARAAADPGLATALQQDPLSAAQAEGIDLSANARQTLAAVGPMTVDRMVQTVGATLAGRRAFLGGAAAAVTALAAPGCDRGEKSPPRRVEVYTLGIRPAPPPNLQLAVTLKVEQGPQGAAGLLGKYLGQIKGCYALVLGIDSTRPPMTLPLEVEALKNSSVKLRPSPAAKLTAAQRRIVACLGHKAQGWLAPAKLQRARVLVTFKIAP